MIENKNQPAFPVSEETTDRIDAGMKIYSGLSKREYFAGLALQGFVSRLNVGDMSTTEWAAMFRDSVEAADALLTELSKPQALAPHT